ncbi:hypothetical protein QTP88_027861 [Uroleucon formosanum]
MDEKSPPGHGKNLNYLNKFWPDFVAFAFSFIVLQDIANQKQNSIHSSQSSKPILTRWGTWINAAIYYCEHFSLIKRVVMELDEDDAISIKKAHDSIKDSNVECNSKFIKSNFSALTSAILRLEKTGCPLSESIKIVLDVQNTIDKSQNKVGKAVQLKMKTVLEKNTRFKSICTVSKILNDEEMSKLELPEDLNLDDYDIFGICSDNIRRRGEIIFFIHNFAH